MKQLTTTMFAMFAMSLLLTGCPKKKEEPKDTTAPKATETAPAVTETPAKTPDPKPDDKVAVVGNDDMPAECNEYKALADKLGTPQCDKLGAARDNLKTSFDSSWKAWAALPAADRASAAGACKAAAQGLKSAAAAACGW